MERRKPKILLIGHGRHGKDDFAKILSDLMGLSFTSSSIFVANEMVWPAWGKERYDDFDTFFEDRVNHRDVWKNLISAYNTPDKTKTVTTMFERDGMDIYVGMRARDEYEACMKADKFDHVIWIDACNRLLKEPTTSMQLDLFDADIYVNNNDNVVPDIGQTLEEAVKQKLLPVAESIQEQLHGEGFDVNFPGDTPIVESETELDSMEEPTKGDRLTWADMPVGSTQVLDHGFIRTEDVYGTDAKICEAARMSYGRGTKSVNKDEGLIRYLVTNYHTSPLEMASIKFHLRVPIFVMRQLVRHRTAKLNEYSGRYSEMVRLFYVPETAQICYQDTINKQASGAPLPFIQANEAAGLILNSQDCSFDDYERLLSLNVSRETARIVLPLGTYTEVVWQMDISNLLKFLYLRDDSHAQWEIRVFAQEIAKAVKEHFPSVYKAYERVSNSVTLTQDQLETLIGFRDATEDLPRGEMKQIQDLADKYGFELTNDRL